MDGGYYAIKGFEYQIDKTLLEVLISTDSNAEVCLEQIQDINNGDYVMQVKYKETAKLTPSVIRKPIVQLINEFLLDSTKDYILYCFFGDTNGHSENVDLAFLNEILGVESSSFRTTVKEQFIAKFKLCFSEDFQSQFLSVLTELQELSFCNSTEEAIYYYSILEDYLRKKVVNHPPADMANRKVTKKELIEYLGNGRKIIFTSAYKEFKGELAYFRLVKTNFKKPVKSQNTIIVFGSVKEETIDVGNLVHQIIKKHYIKATYDVKPILFVIPDDKVEHVKRILIQEKSFFNDGYELISFSKDLLFSGPIINRKKSGTGVTNSLSKSSFYSRVISKTTFDTITEIDFNPSWIFIATDKNPRVDSINYQIITELNTNQLLKLF
jgi:hypothetical protein